MERLDEEEQGLMEVLDSGSILLGIERDEEMEGFLYLAANPAYHHEFILSQKSNDCSSSVSSTTTVRRKVEASSSSATSCSSNKYKKQKKEGSANSMGTIKVRKDKLGERISALQQLVSPFGKSDTASVLTEALGYIHFLQDQVQVLSSPYLKRMPATASQQQNGQDDAPRMEDLRSRGLCLVPISCIEEVVNDNGADLWSSLMRTNLCYSDL